MEKIFALYHSHCIYIDDEGITIDDFYYPYNGDLPISKIEEIYFFPVNYLQNLVNTYRRDSFSK